MYDQVKCELRAYKKGYLILRLDFQKNVLVWEDSSRWYNNFVKGLSAAKMKECELAIKEFEQNYKEPADLDEPKEPQHYLWQISLFKAGKQKDIRGYGLAQEDWQKLMSVFNLHSARQFKL